MIIYEGSCKHFVEDSLNPSRCRIEDTVEERMRIMQYQVGPSERKSWSESLPALAKVIRDYNIPDNADIGIEYTIKGDKHRIDAIICGKDENGKETAIVIELKQWSNADHSNKPCFVLTNGGRGTDDYWHPSYQAANYAGIMKNYYAYIQDTPVIMRACSYLHNMSSANYEVMGDELAYPGVKNNPVFLKGDEERLGRFIHNQIKEPSDGLLQRIDHSDIRPSPELVEMLNDAIKGNDFFSYSPEQADAVSQ